MGKCGKKGKKCKCPKKAKKGKKEQKESQQHPAVEAAMDVGKGYVRGGLTGAAMAGGHHALKFMAKRGYGKKK